jgi:hypothetical protein
MYRVCLKKDGTLIEMQSGGEHEDKKIMAARLDTLRQNALNAGYVEGEFEVKWVTSEEWAVLKAEIEKPTAAQIAEAEKEALIQAKMRDQAIAALKVDGVLDDSGKVISKKVASKRLATKKATAKE